MKLNATVYLSTTVLFPLAAFYLLGFSGIWLLLVQGFFAIVVATMLMSVISPTQAMPLYLESHKQHWLYSITLFAVTMLTANAAWEHVVILALFLVQLLAVRFNHGKILAEDINHFVA